MKEPNIICARCGKIIKTLVEFTDDEIDEIASGIKRNHYCDYCSGVNYVAEIISRRKSELIYELTEHNCVDTFARTGELDRLLVVINNKQKRK